MARPGGLLIIPVLGLFSLTVSGCRPQHSGVPCRVNGAYLWLQPNGTFLQDYTYTPVNLVNPSDQSMPLSTNVNTGHWRLVLPGARPFLPGAGSLLPESGSPDGRAYVLFQDVVAGSAGDSFGAPGVMEHDLVLASDIHDLKKVLSPAQILALSTAKSRPPAPAPKPPAIVIRIGSPT